MDAESAQLIVSLLTAAWLLPVVAAVVQIAAPRWTHRLDPTPGWVGVGCTATGLLLSLLAMVLWGRAGGIPIGGIYYELARFGGQPINIDYHIDAVTLLMFVVVNGVSCCIHVFARGYMSDELTEGYLDHEVEVANGDEFERPGRFHRFYAFLSLFGFSMLGLLIAGNLLQVFVFWELVGFCSWLLIGFYVERHSATTAANKAFIMNRVGDAGFLIGLMIFWTSLGTFQFADRDGPTGSTGMFSRLQTGDDHHLTLVNDGKDVALRESPQPSMPYAWLVVGGLGILAGCVGKSAQFPLQTWLPDAMEGPTPVSALVHSATMVAAGVYLVARCYPLFTAEVLLLIAYVGMATLFIGATQALLSYDLKQVLAYSTISQLGYMFLALGVGGWAPGVFHLVTHAAFKSLLFLCAGSVIAATHHTQDLRKLGGLRHVMPVTAVCALIGVIALSGLAIPLITVFGEPIAFSGHHSKDSILAAALTFVEQHPEHGLLFAVPLFTAGLTACYMFRLWLRTFAGERRHDAAEHHHHQAGQPPHAGSVPLHLASDHMVMESPLVMTAPLAVLAMFAVILGIGGDDGPLYRWINHNAAMPVAAPDLAAHTEHDDAVHRQAGQLALLAAFAGTIAAWVVYGSGAFRSHDFRKGLGPIGAFLTDRWQFDALYDTVFIQPVHVIARWCQWIDRKVFDSLLHRSAAAVLAASAVDRRVDEQLVDGAVRTLGRTAWQLGGTAGRVQTGQVRQYILWLGLGVVVLFAVAYSIFPE